MLSWCSFKSEKPEIVTIWPVLLHHDTQTKTLISVPPQSKHSRYAQKAVLSSSKQLHSKQGEKPTVIERGEMQLSFKNRDDGTHFHFSWSPGRYSWCCTHVHTKRSNCVKTEKESSNPLSFSLPHTVGGLCLLVCWFWKITEIVGCSSKNFEVGKVCVSKGTLICFTFSG